MRRKPIIYKPWSFRTLLKCMAAYRKGQTPVLNLDLTAKCTFCSCLYCDSKVGAPHSDELTNGEVIPLIRELHSRHGLQLIFICGIGEPSEDPKFFKILETAKSLGIEVSLFSNGMGFTKEDIKKLKSLPVNISLKLDSFNEATFDTILGRPGNAAKVYEFLDSLMRSGFVRVKNNETNLALSVVPTKLNIAEIKEVVEFCKKNDVFPAIGEMEESNRAALNYNRLALSRDQLLFLKSNVSGVLGYQYQRPLCPGIIPSLHITNTGDCVVHKQTGLSCGWFFMNEVQYQVIGNIRRDPVEMLLKKVRSYRLRMESSADVLLDRQRPVFGGGGSQPSEWRGLYLSLLEEIEDRTLMEGRPNDRAKTPEEEVLRNYAV